MSIPMWTAYHGSYKILHAPEQANQSMYAIQPTAPGIRLQGSLKRAWWRDMVTRQTPDSKWEANAAMIAQQGKVADAIHGYSLQDKMIKDFPLKKPRQEEKGKPTWMILPIFGSSSQLICKRSSWATISLCIF